jgi:ABC-type dipeptide/oligopeptide/nickel transport system ATPase subunit
MICISDLTKKFQDTKVLENISFNILENKSIAIVGESGSGKSTLASIIMALDGSFEGSILFNGKSIKSMSKKELYDYRKSIGFVFQNSQDSLNPRHTIRKILSEPLKNFTNLSKKEIDLKILQVLKSVSLEDINLDRLPYTLSSGQQKRVSIARAIVANPKLLIIDEGTSCLDPEIKKNIINLINKLAEERNIAFLIISHDIDVATKLASQILILKEGRIVEYIENYESLNQIKTEYGMKLIDAVPKFCHKILGGIYEK